jgi:hypothetical protein
VSRSLAAAACTLLSFGCGGSVEPAAGSDPCGALDDPTGVQIRVGDASVTIRSATAVVDEKTALLAVVFTESQDACRDWLAWVESGASLPLIDVGVDRRDLASAPVALPIKDHFLPPKGTSIVTFAADCRQSVSPQRATSGILSVTAYRPGERIAGTFDAVIERGQHVAVSFDTCFCRPESKCSTRL